MRLKPVSDEHRNPGNLMNLPRLSSRHSWGRCCKAPRTAGTAFLGVFLAANVEVNSLDHWSHSSLGHGFNGNELAAF